MKSDTMTVRAATFTILASVFAIGFATLAARLKVEQVDRVAEHRGRLESQSSRIVQTAGLRGRSQRRSDVRKRGSRGRQNKKKKQECEKPKLFHLRLPTNKYERRKSISKQL